MKPNTNRRGWMAVAWAIACLAGGSMTWADQIQLTGTIRDFKRGDRVGGHSDFETTATVSGHGSYGHVPGMVTMDLSGDGKPIFNSVRPSNNPMTSRELFDQWYRDVPSVNVAIPYTLTLSNGTSAPGGIYTYSNSKFFPIDAQGWGNESQKDSSGKVRNFSFTFELHTSFSYRAGQKFTFVGDDDVWVYINGKKVIDLGGVHSAITGTVLLFDGKAFVNKNAFTLGGDVLSVSSGMASDMSMKWAALSVGGSCPISSGDYYIDLNLNQGEPDVLCTFSGSQASVRTTRQLSSVVLKFSDNSVQKFDSLGSITGGTFTGSGAYANKSVSGLWIKTVQDAQDAGLGYGQYYGSDGSGGPSATLDFFFAERHVTESNFRIDTSILLKPKISATVPPLYD